MEDKEETTLNLREYLAIIRKRIWLLISVFVPVVTFTAISSYKATPIYRATALLQIEKRRPNVVGIEGVYEDANWPYARSYYETQHRLIKSRMVCSGVLQRLSTSEQKKYLASKDPVKAFIGNVAVSSIPDTFLVEVSYESDDSKAAAKAVNEIADEYVSAVKREKKVVSDEAEAKIMVQIPLLRKTLTESEAALRRFEEENSALSFRKHREIIYQSLSTLNIKRTKVRQEIAAAKANVSAVQNAKTTDEILSLSEITQNQAIQSYMKERFMLEAEKARLALEYAQGSEEMKTIESKLQAAGNRIREDALRIAKGIEKELLRKEKEEDELKILLAKQEQLAKSIDANMYKYDSLKAEVEGNRRLYEEFVKRQKELQSSSQFDPGTVRIIDRAQVPNTPVRPRKMMNTFLAAVFSLLGGIGLAFLLEQFDDSINGHDDIERHVKLPLLGIVPHFKNGKKSITEKDLVSHHKPKSNISEAYRNIRTSLIYASPNQKAKAYVVSSAGPQEGKTTTAINIAIALAHAGSQVLLVDTDLRKPRIHKTFDIDGSKGLTNYLVGQGGLDDLISKTEVENMFVLPSGPIPPNPAELLGSPKMKEFIAEAKKSYKAIVFDSPPLVAVTDAAVLAVQSDGLIQVIWAGHSNRKLVVLGKEKVQNVGAKIVGVILNNMKIARRGYYYSRYYHKYYGSQENTSSDKQDV